MPRQRGSSDTLELPRQQMQEVPPAAPTIPANPGNSVLIIPQASHDFVGEWGGRLSLAAVRGRVTPPSDAIVSIFFGEQNGSVVMRTTAFANPNSHILRTSVKALDARNVELKLEGLEVNRDPPVRHIETLNLALSEKGNALVCTKYVDLYVPGLAAPLVSIEYKGKLRVIDAAQRAELEREVIQSGEVPQQTIDAHRRLGR